MCTWIKVFVWMLCILFDLPLFLRFSRTRGFSDSLFILRSLILSLALFLLLSSTLSTTHSILAQQNTLSTGVKFNPRRQSCTRILFDRWLPALSATSRIISQALMYRTLPPPPPPPPSFHSPSPSLLYDFQALCVTHSSVLASTPCIHLIHPLSPFVIV